MDFLYIGCSLNKPDKPIQSQKVTFLLQHLEASEEVKSLSVPS